MRCKIQSKVTVNNQPFIKKTVNLGRTIGVDHLVETTEDDNIVFFDRGRGYKSRMVLDRKPVETQEVTVIIARASAEDGKEWDGKLVLVTLFEGNPGMPEPYGRYANDEGCIKFWANHALVPTECELAKLR